jgi:hypothetical protein
LTKANSEAIPRVSARKYRGLGDVVANVAKPVTKLIDGTLGTDLQNCPGCHDRQEWLNAAVPFGKSS